MVTLLLFSLFSLSFFTFSLSPNVRPLQVRVFYSASLSRMGSGAVPLCQKFEKKRRRRSPLQMTFGNPLRSAGAAVEGKASSFLFWGGSIPNREGHGQTRRRDELGVLVFGYRIDRTMEREQEEERVSSCD